MNMCKIPKIVTIIPFLALLVVSPAFSGNSGPSKSYDDLLAAYLNRSALLPEATTLEVSLISEAEDLEPIDLWRSIRDLNKPAKIRSSNGLALIRNLFPGGDPGRWDEISGLWFPQLVSKPLAAFDAVYYTSIALLELDESAAPWLAQRLMEDLRSSPRAAFLALRTAPLEYLDLVSRLESRTGLTPIGGWPAAETSGKLPFAHAASSFVTQNYAMMNGMVFMNISGQPVSGTGPFAWDREKGRVYRVVESRGKLAWWVAPR
ncbi:MAG: hypothetical protein STSR0007_12490 [Thermovirga sp.]